MGHVALAGVEDISFHAWKVSISRKFSFGEGCFTIDVFRVTLFFEWSSAGWSCRVNLFLVSTRETSFAMRTHDDVTTVLFLSSPADLVSYRTDVA